jgi:hypothetical protein
MPTKKIPEKKKSTRSSGSESLRLERHLVDLMRDEEAAVEAEVGIRPSHSDVIYAHWYGSSPKAVRQALVELCQSRMRAAGGAAKIPGAKSAKDIQRSLFARECTAKR